MFIQNLPVVKEFSKIKEVWGKANNFVLQAPTGSGKSLGLPWSLLKAKLLVGQVLVVQPRRIAAVSLAKTLSSALNTKVGDAVGYQIRFDNQSNEYTKIIYVTDGILYRLLQSDPTLSRVGLVIFDEFHERTLKMDASLALLKKVQACTRPNLKLLLTSATIDIAKASSFLKDCEILTVSGRTYPVEIIYKKNTPPIPLHKQIEKEAKRAAEKTPGDLLIFVDGLANIRKVIREIQSQKWSRGYLTFGLHGEMSKEQQDKVFDEIASRKIIVATNIAETSLTIPGVRIVIDSGISKVMKYDSLRAINSLLPQKISKSSADQRSGRAGRVSHGICVRLWSEADHAEREEYQKPEIKRLDLSELYLELTSRDLSPEDLDWYDPPSFTSWEKAKKQLQELSLLTHDGRISTIGKSISSVPLHPRFSLALNHAVSQNCLSELAIILSIAESRSPFSEDFIKSQRDLNPQCSSDLNLLLESYFYVRNHDISFDFCRNHGIHFKRLQECEKVAIQYCSYFNQPFDPQDHFQDEISKILVKIFPDNIVRCKSEGRKLFENTKGKHFFASSFSMMGGVKWAIPLIVTERLFKGQIQTQMDLMSEIQEEWILDLLPADRKEERRSYLDMNSRKVMVESYLRFGVHKLNLKREYEPNEEDIAKAYAQAIFTGDLSLKNWSKEVDQLLNRLSFLANKSPDLGLRALNDEDRIMVLELICLGKKNWKEIKNAEILPVLNDYLGDDKLNTLDFYAPREISFGNKDRKTSLFYTASSVTLKIKLQELYDVEKHPALLNEKIPVIVEILAPNGRPVQRTSNILDFWKESYLSVRKDLAGRYPKHEWR